MKLFYHILVKSAIQRQTKQSYAFSHTTVVHFLHQLPIVINHWTSNNFRCWCCRSKGFEFKERRIETKDRVGTKFGFLFPDGSFSKVDEWL